MAKDPRPAHGWWWRVSELLSCSFSHSLQFVFLLHSPSPEHVASAQTEHIQSELHITPLQHIPNRWRWVESAARIVHKQHAFELFYYFSVIHYVFPWMVASRSALQLKARFLIIKRNPHCNNNKNKHIINTVNDKITKYSLQMHRVLRRRDYFSVSFL